MLKKLLSTFLFITLFSALSAQNWRPFNPSDTVRHYLAKDSTQRHITFYPILSTVIDSSYTQNSESVYIFKKGFSYLEADNLYNSNQSANSYQRIKGKILGDTATFYTDSTIITSIDDRGFKLLFPKHYYLGKSWLIANSYNQSITANVDSIYYDSIPEIAMDSMVSFQLQLFDSTGNLVNNSTFNQQVILSKNHGIVRTIDFTDLEETHAYQLYAWKTKDEKYYKQEEYFQLGRGDFYFTASRNAISGLKINKYTILSDTTINQIRTQYIQKEISQSSSIPNSPLPFQPYDTIYITNNIKIDSNYRVKQSGIISDSNLVDPYFNPYTSPQFGLRNKWGEKWLIEYTDQNLEISKDHWWPFAPPDSIRLLIFESSGVDCPLIGVDMERDGWWSAFGLQYYYDQIFFLKKGNQTWGTPPLTVGLAKDKKSNSFKFFPNPTKGKLLFSTQENIVLIRVYDQNGRLVKHWDTPQNEIDVSELSKGLYFISLQTQSGELINRKFVKQ
ncbi:MAG: T9SS type A sorting domain-containing protein [Vicingaceae bacterium]